jgi:LPS-assembly lipoprotein
MRIRSVFFLALVLGLNACGWQPRGAQELPPELAELRLVVTPPEPRFVASLERSLAVSGVMGVERAGAWALHATTPQQALRNVALDRGARSAEQEMRLEMQFELRNGNGDTVFGPRTLTASRVYAYDPNSVIAKLDEEKIIRQELQENLVGQLFRQLGRIDATMLAR